jgi:dihydroorotase
VGAPADICLFDLHKEWVVDTAKFASKGRNTPLAGQTLKGKVMATFYMGMPVYAG